MVDDPRYNRKLFTSALGSGPRAKKKHLQTCSRRWLKLHKSSSLMILLFCMLYADRVIASTTPSGTVPCDDGATSGSSCTYFVGLGSECIQGLCSNPFVSGCLRAMLGQNIHKPSTNDNNQQNYQAEEIPSTADPKRTLRVCNSQDDEGTIANNLCVPSPLDYMEIRILTGNWESSLLTAWALQIVLSEFMQVPTSIESSGPELKANFYHPANQFDYGAIAYDFQALDVANKVGDCRNKDADLEAAQEKQQSDDYVACAHVMPEVWNGQAEKLRNLTKRHIIEAPEGNGVVGRLTWFIPKYVAERHPEWAHYSGWINNQTDLATQFLQPRTWKWYCDEVSPTHCEEPEDFSTRPPTEAEEGMFYDTVGGGVGFLGYFHPTDDNMGHFADFPCDWSSFAVPQAYHLGIRVESKGSAGPSGGYTYGEKIQIWQAANATKQNVVMNWYSPDPTYQWYRGTEAEFQEVQLPPPSPGCVRKRVTEEERCSADAAVRVGSPEGACGAEIDTLEKVVVENFHETIYNLNKNRNEKKRIRGGEAPDISHRDMNKESAESARSPAYEAVKNFHLSEFDVGKMFEDWRSRLRARGHNGYSTFEGTNGADPRHVVCQWVADNAEDLQTFVPSTYPRILQEDSSYNGNAVHWVALSFGIIVAFCILGMGILTYRLREEDAFKTAQLPFLNMVLLGLLVISSGGIVYALAPGSGTCVARIWLTNMGYTLEMVSVTHSHR
jgi:ABC-type proline/glycine betaine transport system substrate-binding protein